jgi:hypothetical protein
VQEFYGEPGCPGSSFADGGRQRSRNRHLAHRRFLRLGRHGMLPKAFVAATK